LPASSIAMGKPVLIEAAESPDAAWKRLPITRRSLSGCPPTYFSTSSPYCSDAMHPMRWRQNTACQRRAITPLRHCHRCMNEGDIERKLAIALDGLLRAIQRIDEEEGLVIGAIEQIGAGFLGPDEEAGKAALRRSLRILSARKSPMVSGNWSAFSSVTMSPSCYTSVITPRMSRSSLLAFSMAAF
jgi:hypothetical protein